MSFGVVDDTGPYGEHAHVLVVRNVCGKARKFRIGVVQCVGSGKNDLVCASLYIENSGGLGGLHVKRRERVHAGLRGMRQPVAT